MAIENDMTRIFGAARLDPRLFGVLVLSLAMLSFQILQVTVLGLQLLPEAGFLVVSLSMLGLGSGGSIAALLARRRDLRIDGRGLWATAVGFSVSSVASLIVTSRAHDLGTLVLIAVVPYVFAGLFLAWAFASRPERSTMTYFFDLIGAALGCMLIVYMLDGFGDAGLVALVIGAIGAVAAALVAYERHRGRLVASVVLAGIILLLIPQRATLFPFDPGPQKFYSKLLAHGHVGGTVERRRWNHLGRIDAVAPGPAIGDFEFTRGVRELLDGGASFRLLFSNGYNWTYTIDFRGLETVKQTYLSGWAQHLPYLFLDTPDVLNLGAGGGIDMYFATLHGARRTTGVEINPLMIEATRGWYPAFWDGMWQRPDVALLELDARTFVNTTPDTYDLITLNAVDTAGTQASLLSPNFLYTTEAFAAYLAILRPHGAIFLTRPRDQLLRAIAAAVAALRARGAARPAWHVAVVGSGELLSTVIFASPLDTSQVMGIRKRLDRDEFTGHLQYLPGSTGEANLFVDYFTAVEANDEGRFLASATKRFDPTTDDRPYFYQQERDFPRSGAGRLLRTILSLVLGVAVVLVFVPLVGVPVPHKGAIVFSHLLYFGCLGMGFMLLEIGLVTRLGLFLGHPGRALTVTLASLLFASGLGSMSVGGAGTRAPGRITLALVAIVLMLASLGFVVERLSASAVRDSVARIALVVGILFPVGFALGMPFPLKLQSLGSTLDALVPWAWALNGFASVAGSVLAVAIAMTFGFRILFAVAATCYATALLVHVATVGHQSAG